MKTLAIKVRLRPTTEQLRLLSLNAHASRFIWNQSKELSDEHYRDSGKTISSFDIIKHIPIWRKNHSWLEETVANSLQQAVRRYGKARDMFLKHAKKGIKSRYGQPRFKSVKVMNKQSYDIAVSLSVIDDRHVKIPKVGIVKMSGLRRDINILQILTSTVVVHDDGLVTLSIHVVTDARRAVRKMLDIIGLDVGTIHFVTDHQGNHVKPVNFKKLISRQKYLQEKLERQTKDSKRYTKTKHNLARVYRKIANARKDFAHKLSNEYALDYDIIAVEKLDIREMVKNTVGGIEKPNYDSKRKSRQNNSIIRQGWSIFFDMLEYKLRDRNGQLVRVDPKHTSQACNKCGVIDAKSRDRESYVCTSCGHRDHADTNAAKNIRDRAFRLLYTA